MKPIEVRQRLTEDLSNLKADLETMNSSKAFKSAYGSSKYPANDCLYDFLEDANYNSYDEDPEWNRLLSTESDIDSDTLDRFHIKPYDVTSDGTFRMYSEQFPNANPGPMVVMKVVISLARNIYHQFRVLAKSQEFKDMLND